MLVSHRKKFVYTKTVKTAGTSVESYFEPYCMAESEWVFAHYRDQHVTADGVIGSRGPDAGQSEWYNHMSASEIRSKIGTRAWDNYFKFCVVRNPFDKLVSLFFFQKEKGLLGIENNDDPVGDFRRWIARKVPVPDRNQYMINGDFCVDYFIRFEDLANGIKFVCDRLGLPFEPEKIPRLKSGIRDLSVALDDFYSEETARLVYRAYELEIREFEYSLA